MRRFPRMFHLGEKGLFPFPSVRDPVEASVDENKCSLSQTKLNMN